MVQWFRIHLAREGRQVRSLVQGHPTCHRTTKPVHHTCCCTCPPEPASHSCWSPGALEPCSATRSHLNEKPGGHNQRKPTCSNKEPAQPKINNNTLFYIYIYIIKTVARAQDHNQRKPTCSNKDPAQPKINNNTLFYIYIIKTVARAQDQWENKSWPRRVGKMLQGW